MDSFEQGVLLGLLVSDGHFGGDGLQPQVTLKMHVRHETLFRWIHSRVPGARLYGPYHHGGRSYFQLMVRGDALKSGLVPLLKALPWPEIDTHTYARFRAMLEKYIPEAL